MVVPDVFRVSLAIGGLLTGTAGCGETQPDLYPTEPTPAASMAGFPGGLLTRFASAERPEGITMNKSGDLFVGISTTGNLYRLRNGHGPSGEVQHSLVATLSPGLFGLAVDARGDLLAAVASFDPATHGVWLIPAYGSPARIPGSHAIFFPNALAFDARGNLYITSSSGPPAAGGWLDGQIWRVPPGGQAELWLQHELLTGTGDPATGPPFPLGVNGIAHRHGELVVANTEKGLVVTIPVQGDHPGSPATLASGLSYPDGLALDVHGAAYVVEIGLSRLVRLTSSGIQPLAGPLDGVHFATSLVFGTVAGDQTSVFLANAALPLPFPLPNPPGPSVLQLDVGVPGLPSH